MGPGSWSPAHWRALALVPLARGPAAAGANRAVELDVWRPLLPARVAEGWPGFPAEQVQALTRPGTQEARGLGGGGFLPQAAPSRAGRMRPFHPNHPSRVRSMFITTELGLRVCSSP